jgi:hypothetical protein
VPGGAFDLQLRRHGGCGVEVVEFAPPELVIAIAAGDQHLELIEDLLDHLDSGFISRGALTKSPCVPESSGITPMPLSSWRSGNSEATDMFAPRCYADARHCAPGSGGISIVAKGEELAGAQPRIRRAMVRVPSAPVLPSGNSGARPRYVVVPRAPGPMLVRRSPAADVADAIPTPSGLENTRRAYRLRPSHIPRPAAPTAGLWGFSRGVRLVEVGSNCPPHRFGRERSVWVTGGIFVEAEPPADADARLHAIAIGFLSTGEGA